MEQNLNIYQSSKKSLAAIILMIMAASFTFLYGLVYFSATWPIGFGELLLFLAYLAPMILLIVYMLGYQDKQKATALVPVAFIVLTIFLFITTFMKLTKSEYYAPDAQGLITIGLALLCYIPMIVFSSMLIAAGYKGFKKKGIVNAFSVFAFIIGGVRFIYILILYTDYYLGSTLFAIYLFEILSLVLFAVSLIVFARNGNIPTLINDAPVMIAPLVENSTFCPICGEKLIDGATFCHKCGNKC